jgi:hypothetical protein
MAYLIILATTVAGVLQAAWWAAVAGACILALLFIAERRSASSPTGYVGATDETFASIVAFINGSVACSAAFLLGRATAWLWGI